MAVYELFVDDFFVMSQGTGNNPFGRAVVQSLVISQNVTLANKRESISQRFEIAQSATVRKSIINMTVSQYLPFYQQDAKGPSLQAITQFFHMWQTARLSEYEAISQSLIVNQIVTVTKSKNATNTLVMTDQASHTIIRNLACTQTFTMHQGTGNSRVDEDTYSVTIPTFSGPNVPEC